VNQRHDRVTESMPSPAHARIRHVTTSQSASCSRENEQTHATWFGNGCVTRTCPSGHAIPVYAESGAKDGSTERTAYARFGSQLGRSLRRVGVAADARQRARSARDHRPNFGRTERRGLLAHFHRHGHVAIEDIVNLFVAAGLTATRTGPVGMNDLNFVVAEASGAKALDGLEGR
jgi:hypothetical protein